MTTQETLIRVGKNLPELKRKFAVRRIGIFGSVARGEATADSDLDILVDFEGSPTFDGYMGLKLLLEVEFGVRVDLAIVSDLRPALRAKVDREVKYVP